MFGLNKAKAQRSRIQPNIIDPNTRVINGHPTGHIKIYHDRRKGWRWSLIATNGKVMADSAEGYARKRNAVLASSRFIEVAQTARIVMEDK